MHQTVRVFYFSPTGGVRRVARALGSSLAKAQEFFDLSDQDVFIPKADGELPAVFAVPVFAGRVPAPAKRCAASRARARLPWRLPYTATARLKTLCLSCATCSQRRRLYLWRPALLLRSTPCCAQSRPAGRMRATCRRLKLSRRRCRKNWTAAGMRRYLFRAAGRTARANRSRCGHRLRTDA